MRLIVVLIMTFVGLAGLIPMLPVFADLIGYGVDSLDCSGINYVSCMAFNLIIPIIVLGGLVIISFYLLGSGGGEQVYYG